MREERHKKVLLDDPRNWLGYSVHVDGWSHACVFKLRAYANGVATLETPKTKKIYFTKNPLYHVRKTAESIEDRNDQTQNH